MTLKLAFDPYAAAKDTAVGGAVSTAGTAAGLYGASMLARRFSPAAAKLLHNAGNESWMFLNPMRSLGLLKRLPRAGAIAGRQMSMVDSLSKAKIPSGLTSGVAGVLNDPASGQAAQQASRVLKQHQLFQKEHGVSPVDWFRQAAENKFPQNSTTTNSAARAAAILDRQRRLAESAANMQNAPSANQLNHLDPGLVSVGQQASRATRQAQQYHTDFGETPGDSLEKGIGVANGALNLGIGAGLGLMPHLTGTAGGPAPTPAFKPQSSSMFAPLNPFSRPAMKQGTAVTPELIRQQANSQLQWDTAKNTLGLAGAGFGAGVGLRSLLGLSSLLKRNLMAAPKPSLMSSAAVPIPVEDPYTEGGKKRQKKADIGSYLQQLIQGRRATAPSGIPWAIPAAVAAAPVGMYAGARTADFIADKLRAQELDTELKGEQEQFEAALRGPQPNAKPTKLAQALDRLDAAIEKCGGIDNALGTMLGLYAGYAGISGLSAGSAVYDATKKTQTRAVLSEAIKQREAANNAKRPVPILLADPGEQQEEPLA